MAETVSSTKSFSTLNLLSNYLQCNKIFVVVLDTLANIENGNIRYLDAIKSVESYVRRYLCVDGGNVEIVVVPGRMTVARNAGGRQIRVEFNGDARDAKIRLLLDLYISVLKHGISKGGRVCIATWGDPKTWRYAEYVIGDLGCSVKGGSAFSVVLDLTHGINYLPVIAREAVEEFATAVSVVLGEEARLYIYNSDPYPIPSNVFPQRSDNDPCKPKEETASVPRLSYNLISRQFARPWDITRFLAYERTGSITKIISDSSGCSPVLEPQNISKIVEISKKVVVLFRIGALIELLDLLHRNMYIDSEELDKKMLDVLEAARKCWLDKAQIIIDKINGDEVATTVCRTQFRKLLDTVRLIIHAHSIIVGIKNVIGDELKQQAPNNCGVIKLSWIEKTFEKLLRGSHVIRSIIDVEISKMKKNINSQTWTIYSELLQRKQQADAEEKDICKKYSERVAKRNIDEKDKRDFIAHAGFHSDILEVRKAYNDIEIRIRNDCRDVVEAIIEKVTEDVVG